MGIAGLVDLKKRIKSIQSTKKLTKAMALVATSKLKKTRESLERNNLYIQSYEEIVQETIPLIPKNSQFIKYHKQNKNKLIIAITSDLGMCGAYNLNVVNKVQEIVDKQDSNYKLLVVGERGRSLFKRYKFDIVEVENIISDIPSISEAEKIFNYALDIFSKGIVSEVLLVYTWFKNPLVKEPIHKIMLPLQLYEGVETKKSEGAFDIEGNRENLFNTIIPSYCNAILYSSLINAKTAEQSYRMETMNAASQNAGDLISSLELKYNRIRQSAITQEISEIVGGSEAQG